MGGPQTATAPAPAPGGEPGSPTLVTVAVAVASGLGVLGFVTFAGGVVLWTRFNEMGLPANHALSLVAKSELVATGAEFLVPALLLSALIVLVVIVIGSLGQRSATARREAAMASVLRAAASQTAADTEEVSALLREAAEREAAVRRLTLRWVAPLLIAGVGVALSLAALRVAPASALVLLLGVAILGAVVVSCCAGLPFAAYCLVAFLAVGAFAIARTYERTAHALTVIPMAYSRAQPGEEARVEVGYFVAETSDRIVFASVPESSQNELREFPRGETDDLEVGALSSPGQAEQSAARFAYNLCQRLLALKASAARPGAPPVCGPGQIAELRSKAGLP